eukprot:TRINITY_DN2973_c0_g1_i2.p1 TRINITY_DN2973_c0_g1~~TRINITY_DN2973_c0_g1_i2.p1  ORF type:complete len:1229 (-),score=174.40 TRINITY_DN2973_c0_g1_i2:86-3772(-)
MDLSEATQTLTTISGAVQSKLIKPEKAKKKRKEILDSALQHAQASLTNRNQVHAWLQDAYEKKLIPYEELEFCILKMKEIAENLELATPSQPKEPEKPKPFQQLTRYDEINCIALCQALYKSETQALHELQNRNKHRTTIRNIRFSNVSSNNCNHFYAIAEAVNPYTVNGEAIEEKVIYVAFRGTSDLKDIMTDASAFTHTNWRGKFHSGFYSRARMIPLVYYVDKLFSGYKVVFTGHSIGGAVASVVAARLFLQLHQLGSDLSNVYCVTFGQPPIGDEDLANLLSEMKNPQTQKTVASHFCSYIHPSDPVPKLLQLSETIRAELEENLPDSFRNQIHEFSKYLGMILQRCLEIVIPVAIVPTVLNALKSLAAIVGDWLSKHMLVKFAPFGEYRLYHKTIDQIASWKKVSDPAELGKLLQFSVQNLNANNFSYHSIEQYAHSYFEIWNIKFDSRAFPLVSLQQHRPVLKKCAIKKTDTWLSIRLTGENLSFANKITVSGVVSQLAIQEGYASLNDLVFETKSTDVSFSPTKAIGITIWDHFGDGQYEVPLEYETVPLTANQIKMGRLKPMEVLDKAYLFALLFVSDESASSHMMAVKNDLLELFNLLPLETIYLALAEETNSDFVKNLLVLGLDHQDLTSNDPDILSEQMYCAICNLLEKLESSKITLSDEHFRSFAATLPSRLNFKSGVMNNVKQRRDSRRDSPKSSLSMQAFRMTSGKRIDYINETERSVLKDIGVLKKSMVSDFGRINCPVLCGKTLYVSVNTQPLLSLEIDVWKNNLAELESAFLSKRIGDKSQGNIQHELNKMMLENVTQARSYGQGMLGLIRTFIEQPFDVKLENKTAKRVFQTIGGSLAGMLYLPVQAFRGLAGLIASVFGSNKILIDMVVSYNKLGDWMRNTKLSVKSGYDYRVELLRRGVAGLEDINLVPDNPSYSAELSLIYHCKRHQITERTPLDYLVKYWDNIFPGKHLHRLSDRYKPLVALWLQMILRIHSIRETLAMLPTVGVMGCSNAGKSSLIKNFFEIHTVVGSDWMGRTVIPRIYQVPFAKKLLIADYPGMDDGEEDISKLSEFTFDLSSLAIFVVRFDQVRTGTCNEWLRKITARGAPFLVCLSHADHLYKTKLSRGPTSVEQIKMAIEEEMKDTLRQCPVLRSDATYFTCFDPEMGGLTYKTLREVGIHGPDTVAEWISKSLVSNGMFKEDDVTVKLFLKDKIEVWRKQAGLDCEATN